LLHIVPLDAAAPADSMRIFEGHQQDVFALAYSPDGDLLASAGRDGTIRIWSVESGVCLAMLPAHDDMIFALEFDPKGERLFSAGRDRRLIEWDLSYYDRHIDGNRALHESRKSQ
ncbi:MAG: hypothetical protein VYC34_06845, partial [Planctomycetota bacterium]|nr:hypothetical protein [Planctomycetota bacterium]